MQIKLTNGNQAEIQELVTMRLRRELQAFYLQDQTVDHLTEAKMKINGEALLKAQDWAVKSLVKSLTLNQQIITDREKIFEAILDLPSHDGELIYKTVNQILTESAASVPKA